MTSKKIHIPLILSLGLLLPSFIASDQFTDPFILPKYFYFYFFAVIFLSVFCIGNLGSKYRTRFSIAFLDIAVFAYILYQLVRVLVTPHIRFLNDNLLILLISGIIYFVIKSWLVYNTENKRTIDLLVTGFVLIGLGQACYGILQYANVLPGLQEEFKTAGAYGNPGPYTNFLVPLVPFVLVSIIYRKEKRGLFYPGIIALTAILIVLPLTEARTSWIATGIVAVYVLYRHNAIQRFIRKRIAALWMKITAFALAGILLTAAAVFLFHYKEQSSSGRLFIWKVSVQMIADKPVFGFGFDTYSVAHNNYQADYFNAHPGAEEAELADAVSYAFNEYIQIAAETGLAGLLLFLSLIFFAFFKVRKKQDDKDQKNYILIAARGSLLAILISAMFSYPFRTVPVYMMLFLVLSVISANDSVKITEIQFTEQSRRILSVAGLVLIVLFTVGQAKKYRASKEWLKAFKLVRAHEYPKAVSVYEELYPILNYNRFFLFNYGAELSVMGEYHKSVDLLTEAEERLNDVDLYIYLGNSYAGLGDWKNAASCFKKASLIVPGKFYPKYRLVKIYLELNEYEKALNLAREILSMPVKVPSDIITGIRNEMQELLDKSAKSEIQIPE